jgi:hypothetical protein
VTEAPDPGDQNSVRETIARYRCLLDGRLDAYMRRALTEMLLAEEAKLAPQAANPG